MYYIFLYTILYFESKQCKFLFFDVQIKMTDSNNLLHQKTDPHFGTKAIHVGQNPDQWSFKDVVPPISLTTTYKQYGPNDHAVSFIYFFHSKLQNFVFQSVPT